jgi:hypothetical protein
MFFLETPHFTLLPSPLDPTTWRGVAHTRQGVLDLLALWGQPQNDPQYPFSVFAWQPTPLALAALKTHFSQAQVRPLSKEDHALRWEAHLQRAWLTPDLLKKPQSFSVIKTDTGVKDTLCLAFDTPAPGNRHGLYFFFKKTPKTTWNLEYYNPFFWEARFSQAHPVSFKKAFTKKNAAPVRVTFDVAHEETLFRKAVLAHQSVMSERDHGLSAFFHEKGFFGASGVAQAYLSNTLGAPAERGLENDISHYMGPVRHRMMVDFFKPQCPFLFLKNRHDILAFRAIAHTHDEATQKAAFFRELATEGVAERELNPVFWQVVPRVAAQHWVSQGGPFHETRDSLTFELKCAFYSRFLKEDTAFFDELALVRTAQGDPWDRLRPTKDDYDTRHWCDLFRVWDLQRGLNQWQTAADPHAAQEGLECWARAVCAPVHVGTPTVFDRPMNDTFGPSTIRALATPAFLTGLEKTGFWEKLENTPNRHPEWEALLERHLLIGMHCPVVRGALPHPKQ